MTNKINIVFLTKLEALFEYECSSYFKNMSSAEINKRRKRLKCTPRETLIEAYGKYIKEFTNVEKEQFISATAETMDILKSFYLPNKKPIGVIQLKHGIDWDSPYTINHCIVIPQINAGDVTPETIIHEFIHILQRYKLLYPEANEYFAKIYGKWGFKQYFTNQITIPKDFTFQIMTNPDGDNFEWIWDGGCKELGVNGGISPVWLPIFGEDEKGEMAGYLAKLDQNGNLTNIWYPIEKCPWYIKKIGAGPIQLYHPNEIIACNISYNLTHYYNK